MAGVGRRTLYRKSVTDDYLNSTPEPGENEEIALAQAPRGSNIIEIMLASGEQALALLPTRFRKLIWVKRGDYLITSTSEGDFETSAGEAGKSGEKKKGTPMCVHRSGYQKPAYFGEAGTKVARFCGSLKLEHTVRHRVEHILNKDQIKHLKKQDLWPAGNAFGGALLSAARSASGTTTPRDGWGGAVPDGGSYGDDGGSAAADEREGVVAATEEAGDGAGKAGGVAAVQEAVGGGGNGVGDGGGDAGSEQEEWHEEEEEEEDDVSDLFVNNNRVAMMQLRTDHEDDEEDSDSDSDE